MFQVSLVNNITWQGIDVTVATDIFNITITEVSYRATNVGFAGFQALSPYYGKQLYYIYQHLKNPVTPGIDYLFMAFVGSVLLKRPYNVGQCTVLVDDDASRCLGQVM